jgi:ribonuclease D
MTKTKQLTVVTTDSALAETCAQLAAADAFAFDTEFVGEDSYEPEICLVQVATDRFCALLDPLAGLDLSPLWRFMADTSQRVIVHAGAEDVAICLRHAGKLPKDVFDLQVAAGFVGLDYPISLSRLAKAVVGAVLHKSQTLTDWRRRPLTQEQIKYAAGDVLHLPAICRSLTERLADSGRLEWALEESGRVCAQATATGESGQKLRRLRGTGGLSSMQLAIVDALLEEREKLAAQYNRPPRAVLRDHLLVEIARHGLTDVQKIKALRGVNLNAAAVRRLAAVVGGAGEAPTSRKHPAPPDEDTPEEQLLVALATAVLRSYAGREGIAYSLLAAKSDLRTFIRSYTRSRAAGLPILLKTGWRKAAVGGLLDRVLSGSCRVRVIREDGTYRLDVETPG